MTLFYFLIFIYAIAFGILSVIVAGNKNRSRAGWFFIGFIFGVFGFIAALVVEEKTSKTPTSVRATPNQRQTGSATRPTSNSKENGQQLEAPTFDLEDLTKKCPACAERIKLEARVCRYCGHTFEEAEVSSRIAERKEQFEKKRKEMESRWRCRCGALNSGDDELCPECGRSPEAVI